MVTKQGDGDRSADVFGLRVGQLDAVGTNVPKVAATRIFPVDPPGFSIPAPRD
jgi:hypothetical protein